MIVLVVALWILSTSCLTALLWRRSTHGLLVQRCRSRVVVTLKTGEAFSGVLVETDHQALALRDAQALGVGEDRSHVTVDGEVVVLRPDVLFIQLP